MSRRTDYVSFLGPPRDRNRDFAGLESRVALRVFVIPALIVSLVTVSVYWYALRDDNEDTGRVLTLADARIPSVLLPSGAATDDAGLLLAGVSIDCEEEVTEWSAFQGSATHQGCFTAPTISENNATIEWRVAMGVGGWLNSPLIVGDNVIIGSAGRAVGTEDARDGVYAFNLYTGEQEWFFGATLDVNGVGYGNGIVIATGDEGQVWGIDAQDGSLVWAEAVGVATFGYPLVLEEENLVVVGDADGVASAYNLRNGALLWTAKVDGPIRGGAASDGEMIVVAGENREVLALDLGGDQLWRVKVTGRDTAGALVRVWAAPTLVRDLVVITLLREDTYVNPAVMALNKSDGTVAWYSEDRAGIKNDWGSIRSSVAAVGDILVYGEPYSNRLVAIDIESGETTWDVETGAYCYPHWPSPAVVSGQVILPRHDGGLYAVSVETQTVVWSIYLGDSTSAGTFPASFTAGAFCDWAPTEGYSILASPAIAPNGYIIVPTLEGYLVAVADRSWG
ncbi:MAG TPA: PQQ-binding-like beta-propeller repeat protein [Acidimicrobiia bacterium]|nr:PQQ-binding-like beta-propeller repeat protein [Acidimicrobiia bacterium]